MSPHAPFNGNGTSFVGNDDTLIDDHDDLIDRSSKDRRARMLPPAPTIAVLLPCRNEAATIGQVVAEFRQGVLKLRIPKAEHARPRKVEIQVA